MKYTNRTARIVLFILFAVAERERCRIRIMQSNVMGDGFLMVFVRP